VNRFPLWGGFAGYYAKLTSIKYMGMTGTVLLWCCFGLTSISMVFWLGRKRFYDRLLPFFSMACELWKIGGDF
jgi:hypothetical protein